VIAIAVEAAMDRAERELVRECQEEVVTGLSHAVFDFTTEGARVMTVVGEPRDWKSSTSRFHDPLLVDPAPEEACDMTDFVGERLNCAIES
jgi:hypothetical protein